MDIPNIRAASGHELDKVLDTITLAFAADPLMRWILPDPDSYLRHFRRVVSAYSGASVAEGAAFVDDGFGGAALWQPPGMAPDEDALSLIVDEVVKPDRIEDFGTLMAEMDRYHPHDEPCWYLAFIGVDGHHQGRGLGSLLLKHTTRTLDETGTPAYLESSNPANISLYQRHGFEIMGEIRAGSAPLVTPMYRRPQ